MLPDESSTNIMAPGFKELKTLMFNALRKGEIVQIALHMIGDGKYAIFGTQMKSRMTGSSKGGE